MIVPAPNYLLVKRLEAYTGVVTDSDIEDTHQRYEIVAINPDGCYWSDYGLQLEADYKVGQIIYTQKHAEADTPKELADIGQALVMAARVMAVEEA